MSMSFGIGLWILDLGVYLRLGFRILTAGLLTGSSRYLVTVILMTSIPGEATNVTQLFRFLLSSAVFGVRCPAARKIAL